LNLSLVYVECRACWSGSVLVWRSDHGL